MAGGIQIALSFFRLRRIFGLMQRAAISAGIESETRSPAPSAPLLPPRIRPRSRLPVLLALLGCASAGLILYFFNPAENSFYPQCQFHRLTGLSCPGCGGLRALHELSHGHLAAAFRLNALLVVLLPFAGWLALRELVLEWTGHRWPGLVTHRIWGWVLFVVVVAFWVGRNAALLWPD